MTEAQAIATLSAVAQLWLREHPERFESRDACMIQEAIHATAHLLPPPPDEIERLGNYIRHSADGSFLRPFITVSE